MQCDEQGLRVHHHAVPPAIARMNEKNEKTTVNLKGQLRLDGVFLKAPKTREFKRNDALKAIAEFVVCDDQVSR
jgi:hypothetical protein